MTSVNGNSANIGTQVTLASGAKLTLNADGSYVYSPMAKAFVPPSGINDATTYTIAGASTSTLTVSVVAGDSGPTSFGYQGHLASSGGQPITADLSTTFRLYDLQGGGVALWSEVQPAVQVDGGNLAVELGTVNALPPEIFGKQLYLGIQIAGDSEMAPRPPLTAAPYALRASRTMKNTIVISAEGTALQNGAALLAAFAAIGNPSASQSVEVELDAGTFDLGAYRLFVPSFVTLVGRGQDATVITSANVQVTVLLASDSQARRLTVRNTGQPPDDNGFAFAIGAATPAFDGSVSNVTIEDVTGESIAASGTFGTRLGIYFCASASRLSNSIGRGQGGNFSFGMRADCPDSTGNLLDGLTLFSSGGAVGMRGAYLAGGGAWRNIKVFVDQSAPTGNGGVYGIRVFANNVGVGAALIDTLISINGNNSASTVLIEGVRVEAADIDFKGLVVNLENVKAISVVGIRLNANDTTPHRVRISDADVRITGLQDAAQGPGGMRGIRASGAAPEIARTKIKVECLAGGHNGCIGIWREPNLNGNPSQLGELNLEQVSIETGHDAPADNSAQSFGYLGIGSVRISNSSLRVLRSAFDEFQSGVNTQDATADIRVHNSTIEIESANTSPATPNCVLAMGNGGSVELLGSYVDGSSCAPVGPTLTCAGTTKRGAGFIASGCP